MANVIYCQAYEEIMVSAYQESGYVVVYVVVDQPDLTLKYDLHINVIKWNVCEIVNINMHVYT